jgi:phosphoglycerate dehydrogenase-like enzyme
VVTTMKMLLLSQLPAERLQTLQLANPGMAFVPVRTVAEQLAEIVDADAVYGWPHPEALPLAGKLRWIHVGGAGIEQLRDYPQLMASDVVLTNGRGTMARSVADHVFGLILTFTRRLRELARDQEQRRWQRPLRLSQMRELTGAVLGVLGLGQIGSAVARRGAGFEMVVYAVDAGSPPPGPYLEALWGLDRLDDLLRLAEYFVVTVPSTPATRHLIDRRRLALMQPGAYLFVVSRGGIVDEAALIDSLRAGHLAGAGLDVAATEPLPPDSPLWEAPNLVISPHCSGSSPQTHQRLWELLQENVRRFSRGEPLLNVCDKRAGY